MTARKRPPVPVDVALQGGGSHGAFTWGVLDRLLEAGWIDIEGISGTSAGAMNAAVLADLGESSKMIAEWAFLCQLRDEGRRSADRFRADHGDDVGHRSSFDLDDLLKGV